MNIFQKWKLVLDPNTVYWILCLWTVDCVVLNENYCRTTTDQTIPIIVPKFETLIEPVTIWGWHFFCRFRHNRTMKVYWKKAWCAQNTKKKLTKDINNTVYINTTPRHNKRVVHLTSDPRFKHYKVEMEKQVWGVTHRQCEFQSRLAHLGRRRSAGYPAQWLNICQRSPSRSERLRWMDSLVWPYHWSWQISAVGKEKKKTHEMKC